MDDTQELLTLYRQDPCRTLPNAFWKSVRRDGRGSRLILRRDPTGKLVTLALLHGAHLMALWCEDHKECPLTEEDIAKVPLALIHDRCMDVFSGREFSREDAYFRLLQQGRPKAINLPSGYTFCTVDPQNDLKCVAEFINACYLNIKVNPEIVHTWLDHPVYDPDLWLWVIDVKTGQKAGLGIAEYDPQVPEASLEWIQVHPHFQKRGVGKAVVSQLLQKVSSKALFTTVSGRVASAVQPEKLYRRCGFVGSDVWWLLRA